MFLFGERDSWFCMAWDGFREQDGFREHWSSLIPPKKMQTPLIRFARALGLLLTSLRSLAWTLSAQKAADLLCSFLQEQQGFLGREGARKRGNYLHPLFISLLSLPVAPSPFLSCYFSSLQEDISAPECVCSWSCAGVTGPDWGVTGAVPFASEEAKAAEVQILPDDSMW